MRYIIRISETVAVNHIATFCPSSTKNEIVADFEGETPIFFLTIFEPNYSLANAKDLLFEWVKSNARDIPNAVRLAQQIMWHNEVSIDNFRAVILPVQ